MQSELTPKGTEVLASARKMKLCFNTDAVGGPYCKPDAAWALAKVASAAPSTINAVEKGVTSGFTADEIRTLLSLLQRCVGKMDVA